MWLFGSGSRSFLISVIIHSVAFLALSAYLIVQYPEVQVIIETAFFEQTAKLKPHSLIVKTIPKPVVSTEQPVFTTVQITSRVITSAAVRTTNIQPETVLQFSNKYVAFDAKINPSAPGVVKLSRPIEQVVTLVNLPVSDVHDVLDFATPVENVADGEPPIGKGIVESGIRVAQIARPVGLTMVANVGAKLDALGKVVEHITLGEVEVPPLPKGEPGGRIICIDKDIKGVFRFTRVRHSLSDWWADASSLNALSKWLNERTKIKTDMNVEGGAVKLTDANVMNNLNTEIINLTLVDFIVAQSYIA